MKRVFLALNLPLNIKQDIFALYNNFDNRNIKWTAFDNLHITIKFIGETEEDQVSKLIEFLDSELKIKSFKLKIKNSVFFPKFKNPKIIALQGIIDKSPQLNGKCGDKNTDQEINHFLNLLNQKLKFIPQDNHSFTPHITIGRVKGYIDKSQYEFQYSNECEINSIGLTQSILTQQGPIYKIMKSYNLL